MRHLFQVATKAVIFNQDKSKVLVLYTGLANDYGLPGGHIEAGEAIDETMRRELFEECGVEPVSLKRHTFFRHSSGKIVLAYKAVLACDDIDSQQHNLEGVPKWLSREEFETSNIEHHYKALVLANWG